MSCGRERLDRSSLFSQTTSSPHFSSGIVERAKREFSLLCLIRPGLLFSVSAGHMHHRIHLRDVKTK